MRSTTLLLAAAAILAGCVGSIGGDDGTTTGGLDPTKQPESCAARPALAPAPVRRLSRAEYLATIRDLFPSVKLDTITIARDPNERGFENRASLLNPQPMLVEDYSTAAAQIAEQLSADSAALIPCKPTQGQEDACAGQFLDAFGARVFRRPLTADEKSSYVGLVDGELKAGSSFEGAIQIVVEAMLQAPPFLYRIEAGEADPSASDRLRLTGFEVAARMSYLLWGSTPDAALAQKAASGALATPEGREAEARRMLGDDRARAMMVEFHRQWLDLDRISKEPKDPATYPDYTPDLEASIREESDRFVGDVMWKGDGRVQSLFTSTQTEVDANLAKLYGVQAPASGWATVSLDPSQRAGFLTRANFLAARAHKVGGSPPLRAIFVYQRLLCRTAPTPPANADLSEPMAKPGAMQKETNRQLFEDRLAPAQCNGCHQNFTPLGYALENYDAIGRFRTADNGSPVDAKASFHSGDLDWALTSGVDLSQKIAQSPDLQQCATTTWFEYAAGRAADATDRCRMKPLQDALDAAGGDVREMLVALVKDPDFGALPKPTP